MFNFTKEKLIENELSVKNILDNISEIALWRYYLNTDFKLGICIKAPYRSDNNPSFSIYRNSQGRILAKDFGGYFSGGIFDYLMIIYNIDLFTATAKVNNDFNLGLYCDKPIKAILPSNLITKPLTNTQIKKLDKIGESVLSESNKIQVVVRNFNNDDRNYWLQYGIDLNILHKYDVYCAEKVYCNHRLCYTYDSNNPGYVYYFRKSNHVKIYYPNSKQYRFMGNVNNYEDIQGYYQCNVKDKSNTLLILTKSMKDVMLLRKYDIDAMAIHGEKHRFHKDFIRHIKKYYTNIISLYDRDISGIQGAKYLWKEFNIKPVFINKKYNCKDISDLYKIHGSEIVKEFLNKINSI